ncbi:hypothetical protein HTZ97_04545 [Desulfuromonas acetoxidans]|uniref:Uncharacterized protein n=1 Tax=Desulfuromonas acetoxidans (strain DSM 684 / 11070) TaxID=281689 RepID=Q1K108_DESA6|nr:hypothetical protein [Desulfuromonas acetoxidans]EAT16200.1 hypothetical protein Dace_1664 [Desulfuromonas acetoxidans DSM 684]MBF0645226.1 hypothetical protein [Desulfuromonas acetoxidans]NVD23030.1 hypothetical protein [Desulfuromonas acetoxidans]NVE15729.1 hypothetical protein [Desulfuromonas acetoxidans]
MMDNDRLRRISLYSVGLFLAISALFAIITVISGSFGAFEIRVLVTTTVIAGASICSLCCSAYLVATQRRWPAVSGIVLAMIAAVLGIYGAWGDVDVDTYWRSVGIFTVWAIGFAHALALLMVRLEPHFQWLRVSTVVTISANALVFTTMIVTGYDDDAVFKLIAVLSILAALETLLIPIMAKISARRERTKTTPDLELFRQEGGGYCDRHGRHYAVQLLDDGVEDSSHGRL